MCSQNVTVALRSDFVENTEDDNGLVEVATAVHGCYRKKFTVGLVIICAMYSNP